MTNNIPVIHIVPKNDYQDTTICNLGMEYLYKSGEFAITIRESIENEESYKYHERCEICWRDREYRILYILGDL